MESDYLTSLIKVGHTPEKHSDELCQVDHYITAIDELSTPIYSELNHLLIPYRVSFTHHIESNGLPVTRYDIHEVFLGIDVKGEVLQQYNANDPDVGLIITEVRDYILYHVNTAFSITYIIQI